MDSDGPKKKEKRPPENRGPRQEQIGPRTPRMVGTITRARCSNCGAVLQPGLIRVASARVALSNYTAANSALTSIPELSLNAPAR